MSDERAPWVGVIMGSKSDGETMDPALEILRQLDIPHEVRIVSAHRTPDLMFEYASSAESRGLEVIVAAAGGAAHLPGMTAAKTILLVLGVPVPATALEGIDAFLSIAQMPKGVPVGTLAMLWLLVRGALGQLGEADNVISFGFRHLTVKPSSLYRTRRVGKAGPGEPMRYAPPSSY